jgi:hypothetical protein
MVVPHEPDSCARGTRPPLSATTWLLACCTLGGVREYQGCGTKWNSRYSHGARRPYKHALPLKLCRVTRTAAASES